MAKPSYYSTGPASDCIPVTPSDATVFEPCRAFWIGGAGNIAFKALSGENRTVAVGAGLFPVGGSMVLSTGTTATGICRIPF